MNAKHHDIWRKLPIWALQLAVVSSPIFAGVIVHDVLEVGTSTQSLYYQIGVIAALTNSIIVKAPADWGKLLAIQIFIALGILPRLCFPAALGAVDLTLVQAAWLILLPGVFAGAYLGGHWLLSRIESPHAGWFTAVMTVAAFLLHALLLPLVSGEPLRAHVVQVDAAEKSVIAVNPQGNLILAHSPLIPLEVALHHVEGEHVETVLDTPLPGYPVGIRVFDDHALVALRIEDDDKVVERIDFVVLSEDGVEETGHIPCNPAQSPSHVVNNLSPDGQLMVLADHTFVDVTTGETVARLPQDATSDGPLALAEWAEPAEQAVFFDEDNSRLVLFDPHTGAVDTFELRGHPPSHLALSIAPDGTRVWYEEDIGFPNWQRAFVEDLGDRSRSSLTRMRGRGRMDGVQLWAGDTLTYITALGVLTTLEFDEDSPRYRQERRSQLFDMTLHAAMAREGGWLFWTTQASHGQGTAIHRTKLPH